MKIRHLLKTPTMLVRPDRTAVRVGGPHCVRECGQTGQIWVALKGSIACHPGETPDNITRGEPAGSGTTAALKKAKERVCCNPKLLAQRMKQLEDLGYNSPPPEGFAVWRVTPTAYDPAAADGACGGALYECGPSPPMIAIDPDCGCWAAQDVGVRADHTADPSLLHIDAKTHATRQVDVPHPPACCEGTKGRMTGPAIVTAPDGAVWCSLLSGDGAFVRTCPRTGARTLYEIEAPKWAQKQRVIHFCFHTHEGSWCIYRPSPDLPNKKITIDACNVMFAISSNLCDDEAINMVTMYTFSGAKWEKFDSAKAIPLPTQDCSCHRVCVVADGVAPAEQSIVISELHTARLFQMIIHNNFVACEGLMEVPSDDPGPEPTASRRDGTPFTRRKFVWMGGFLTKARRERGRARARVPISRSPRNAFPPPL